MGAFKTSPTGNSSVTNITNVLPAVPRGPRRFGFIADAGEITANRNALAGHIKSRCELVVLGGDQNYSASAASVVSNNAIWIGIEKRAVIGNHDVDFDGGAAHNAHFTGRPASPPGLPNCYHETILGGLVDLIVLDSDRDTNFNSVLPGGVGVGSPMHLWVLSLLPTLTAPHRVFAYHHPHFSPCGASNRHVPELRWDWKALGASVVLNGHVHMAWTAQQDGVRFICAGSGSRADDSLTGIMQGNASRSFLEWASEDDAAAVIFTATSSELQFEFLDIHGRTLHGGSVYSHQQHVVTPCYEVLPVGAAIQNGLTLVTKVAAPFHPMRASLHLGAVIPLAEARLFIANRPITDWHFLNALYKSILILPAWCGEVALKGAEVHIAVRGVPAVEYPATGGMMVGLAQGMVC